MEPVILGIDTSCDETSAAVTTGRRVLSNVISSQINIHQKYGGVYPALAKRAHQERIDFVVREALKRAKTAMKRENEVENENIRPQISKSSFSPPPSHFPLSAIAVTQGPGLAIALEVGIGKAKELANNHKLPLVAVNHMEGHLYSCLAQNSHGLPKRELGFPTLCLLVSGGHTELVLMKNHGQYQVLGQTLDDACGEALDKAAKILKLGYPGGPIIERLALLRQAKSGDKRRGRELKYVLNPPLKEKKNLNFSYSGLKTQFLYLVQSLSEKEFGQNLSNLAFSFQEACFEQLIRKTSQALAIYHPKTLLVGGGVIANKYLRRLLRRLAKENNRPVFFPPYQNLFGDNAAMIGVAAWYKYQRKEFVENPETLDREPRLSL